MEAGFSITRQSRMPPARAPGASRRSIRASRHTNVWRMAVLLRLLQQVIVLGANLVPVDGPATHQLALVLLGNGLHLRCNRLALRWIRCHLSLNGLAQLL